MIRRDISCRYCLALGDAPGTGFGALRTLKAPTTLSPLARELAKVWTTFHPDDNKYGANTDLTGRLRQDSYRVD